MQLDDDEIAMAQNKINACVQGNYLLKEIFGDLWAKIPSRNSFGRRFKNAVCDGRLSRISHLTTKSNNHNVYRIVA